MTVLAGLRLAVTLLTVWPARRTASTHIDPDASAMAMVLAPVVGGVLGGVAAAVALALWHAHAGALLTGALILVLLAVLTRGLHLDGLADTADGLGSFADRDRALSIMKSPEIGPFGVVALVLVLLVDAAALARLVDHQLWWAILIGVTTGRVAITLACRAGMPSARPDGLGALVAGTVPTAGWLAWGVTLAVGAYFVGLSKPWLGPVAVVAAIGATLLLTDHARRRLGGITGDVLGACCELATAISLTVLALG